MGLGKWGFGPLGVAAQRIDRQVIRRVCRLGLLGRVPNLAIPGPTYQFPLSSLLPPSHHSSNRLQVPVLSKISTNQSFTVSSAIPIRHPMCRFLIPGAASFTKPGSRSVGASFTRILS